MNSLHGQQFGRIHRRNFEEGGVERKSSPVTFVVDPKVFMADIEEHAGPVQILKLPKVFKGIDSIPYRQQTTVGSPNADLEEAYAMGFRAAFYRTGDTLEGTMESQGYADQRRSDLKELVSYDRSK